jgi:hypothetical protein
MRVADQFGEHIEHLGLYADHVIAGTQFVALRVENKGVEAPHAGFWR